MALATWHPTISCPTSSAVFTVSEFSLHSGSPPLRETVSLPLVPGINTRGTPGEPRIWLVGEGPARAVAGPIYGRLSPPQAHCSLNARSRGALLRDAPLLRDAIEPHGPAGPHDSPQRPPDLLNQL